MRKDNIIGHVERTLWVFDNSPKQLEQDRFVAERDDLKIHSVQGDMADLSVFSDESFDLIVHPVSNVFVPDVIPVVEGMLSSHAQGWSLARRL
jgi:hypothetical protein